MNHAAPFHRPGSPAAAAAALKGASLAFQRASPPGDCGQRQKEDSAEALTAASSAGRLLSPLAGPLAQLDRSSASLIAAARAAGRKASAGEAVDSESIAPTGSLISMFERARDGAERAGASASLPQPSGGAPAMPAPAGNHRPPAPKSSRSSEKISAMPMPKPKLLLQALAPAPAPAPTPAPAPSPTPNPAGHAHAHAAKLDETRAPSQHPPGGKATPAGTRPSASPSPSKGVAAKPPPEKQPPGRQARTPSPPSVMVSRSAPHVLSPKPVRPAKKPVLASPAGNPGPARPGLTCVSPPSSPDLGRRSSDAETRGPPAPPEPRGSQRRAAAGPRASGVRRRGPGVLDAMHDSGPAASPLTEFGLPIVAGPCPAQRRERSSNSSKRPPPLPRRRTSVASAPTSPVLQPTPPPSHRSRRTDSLSGHLLLNPLTDAVMAGSVASWRLTPHNSGSSAPPASRAVKPQRSPRLLQTLRQPHTGPDEDPERLRIAHRHKLSSNKHAHHEGARNRWRDQITQRERRRYEAVWASNRGHLLQADDDGDDDDDDDDDDDGLRSECVANVVAREIWKRSRLPEDELMEVWDLVDRAGAGMLTRQEFVVGMWLIDQRLKGRKLPARVSDSVWFSANGVNALKARK
ncbi:hypothetical protein UVI_02022960 [Ustilaginoidea virens]|uniref:Increased rDNA silencing protein 4 n=1 Tax=Ustilaginoidea virens TaxID=1159556 RepID=A0A1B5L439_USTVR|nr:hypothetical protein UVI_02022960 [Ustilaginoidea virens]